MSVEKSSQDYPSLTYETKKWHETKVARVGGAALIGAGLAGTLGMHWAAASEYNHVHPEAHASHLPSFPSAKSGTSNHWEGGGVYKQTFIEDQNGNFGKEQMIGAGSLGVLALGAGISSLIVKRSAKKYSK